MSVATLYNSLPTLGEADSTFKDRSAVLDKLAPLLAAYQHQFGVCLVHAHCTLDEGQVMVAQGNISSPSYQAPYYPERWLADGTPYEFNKEPTKTPPQELFEKFQDVVGKDGVLGLFYSGDLCKSQFIPSGKGWLERTEGKNNIVELVDKQGKKSSSKAK